MVDLSKEYRSSMLSKIFKVVKTNIQIEDIFAQMAEFYEKTREMPEKNLILVEKRKEVDDNYRYSVPEEVLIPYEWSVAFFK